MKKIRWGVPTAYALLDTEDLIQSPHPLGLVGYCH